MEFWGFPGQSAQKHFPGLSKPKLSDPLKYIFGHSSK